MLATFLMLVDNGIRGLTIGGAVGMFIAYRTAQKRGPRDPFLLTGLFGLP